MGLLLSPWGFRLPPLSAGSPCGAACWQEGLGMAQPKWAPGAGGCTKGICSPGGKDESGMGRERQEGSWGLSGVQCWPMGCFKALEGSRAPLQPRRWDALVAQEPLRGGLRQGEPQILLEGSIPVSCSGRASQPQLCAAPGASPASCGHWGCSEPAQQHQPPFPWPLDTCTGLDPTVAPHVPGQS